MILLYKKCEKIDTMLLGWYMNFRYILNILKSFTNFKIKLI